MANVIRPEDFAAESTLPQLITRILKGDRYGATSAQIADGDRAALIFYHGTDARGAARIDAIMRGEDPAQRFACGEMLEEDL